jgi:hypothetical protein
VPYEVIAVCKTLIEAQSKIPPGLCRFPRHPNDEPQIVETWF